MLKRFMFASLAFIGLIVPGAFALALLAAPAARPEPLQQAGYDRSLVDAAAGIAAMSVIGNVTSTTAATMRSAVGTPTASPSKP